MKNLVRFQVTKDTWITFAAGAAMIVLSLLMLPFQEDTVVNSWICVVLRDVLMIFGLGICFVSLYGQKAGKEFYQELGFRKDKWKLSVILDVVFAAALLLMFLKDGKPENLLCVENFYGAVYILVAGIFEMVFIYGFLRRGFEKSFGTIPAIVLTAAFYSFHHAGFQPEFVHLFFVGLMYVAVFYITKNLLIVFPFFWAVGALWDVLVDSSAGEGIKNSFSFMVALGIIIAIIVWSLYIKKRNGVNYVVENINCNHGDSL